MPSYSSKQLLRDWRYDVAKDFKSPAGETASWAAGNPLTWGSEDNKIPLSSSPSKARVNLNHTVIAIAVSSDIHVYNLDTFKLRQILRGRAGATIECIAFHPRKPLELVSQMTDYRHEYRDHDPLIVFWDLDKELSHLPLDLGLITSVSQDAVRTIEEGIRGRQIFDNESRAKLVSDVEGLVSQVDAKQYISQCSRLIGRLLGSFQSNVFNNDGTRLIYLPGKRPKSNDVDRWDVAIFDTTRMEDLFVLSGHTDAIMWAGFSPDEKKIGTCCWDQTIRIWNAADGQSLHVFKTDGQNWTGGFSPDSQYFAGTAGDGFFFIWNLEDGSKIASYKFGNWCRAIDWSPDGKYLAVGGRKLGRVVVFDVEQNEVVQERLLSVDKCACADDVRHLIGHSLEVSHVRFMAGGRKLAYRTGGDRGVEIYDFAENKKQRFAPPEGSEGGPSSVVILPMQGMVALMDIDAVRFWKVEQD